MTSKRTVTGDAALPTDAWNDSLIGDFLWTNANFAEAISDVMTPCTWSMWQIYLGQVMPVRLPENFPMAGNIGGRPYLNLSMMASFGRVFGAKPRATLRRAESMFGRIPDDIEIPTVPITLRTVFKTFLPGFFTARKQMRAYARQAPTFLDTAPGWCTDMHRRIETTQDKTSLVTLWRSELLPYFQRTCWVLRAVTGQFSGPAGTLRRQLLDLVGEADTNALLSNMRGAGDLASLGPARGLAKVARGEMTREAYLQQYGHRGPHEMELSIPRPTENPAWLDRQLADFAQASVDVDALLASQRAAFDAAWARFAARYPRKAKSVRRRLAQIAKAAQRREAVRSEATRVIGVVRAFALRAGALTGSNDDIFFLSLDEIQDVLSGDESAVALIPTRRETYARYAALPPYPALIVGPFDPFAWAADPNRRSDIYNAHAPAQAARVKTIQGFAGAAGVVEGIVRKLETPEEGDQFQAGEILVTVKTNVGWTPLFPRAAAVVTDVGAPLSHAAIVAREMGIPAVVGCGNATMVLRTGDRVRVDGSQGMVEVLPAHASTTM
ncbi:MAG: PEP-utilizing enzyme [Anaerolineae bacterium]